MKVLFVSRGLPDERYPMNGIFEFDQAKALAKSGLNVTYFAIDLRSIRRKRRFGIYSGVKDGVNWFSINIPVGAVTKTVLHVIGEWAIRKLYSIAFYDSKPDIIHAHFTDPAYIAAKLADKEHIPLVITEHNSQMNKQEVEHAVLNTAQFAYSKASAVIAVGNNLAKNIEKTTGIQSFVIPNILAETVFSKSIKKEHTDFGFVFAGNLNENKRPGFLLDAFNEVIKLFPNIRLGLIGDGELKEALQEQITKLRLQDRVKMYGCLRRDQMAVEYGNYDCFILPSASETFGVVYIEALAAGLPVIATACGGPEDFVTPDVGFLVPVDDRQALVNAMIKMLESATSFDGKKLRAYVVERFSEEAVANQVHHVYLRCLKQYKEQNNERQDNKN